jgi:hypothetical protein
MAESEEEEEQNVIPKEELNTQLAEDKEGDNHRKKIK